VDCSVRNGVQCTTQLRSLESQEQMAAQEPNRDRLGKDTTRHASGEETMSTLVPTRTSFRTVDLFTDVVIGARRRIKKVTLSCEPRGSRDDFPTGQSRLFLAINPALELRIPKGLSIQQYSYRGDTFLFSFPNWLDMQEPGAWQSQSASGAIYLSRTDLQKCFGVSGVLLLQILIADHRGPCLTSRHKHLRTRELFDPLDAGLGTQYRRGDNVWRCLKDRLEIPPGEPHQLRRMGSGPSVNLIQMYGACGTEEGPCGPLLDMTDHIYECD
jgi:hypothetical protein